MFRHSQVCARDARAPDIGVLTAALFLWHCTGTITESTAVEQNGTQNQGVGGHQTPQMGGIVGTLNPDAGELFFVVEPSDTGTPGKSCTAKVCENFESEMPRSLANNQTFGIWSPNLRGQSSMAIDTTRAFSGTQSLKIHINSGSGGGGMLRTTKNVLFETTQSHLYGRMMLWNSTTATSNHWDLINASGVVPPGSSNAGHYVHYLFGADQNHKFMSVYYDDNSGQDCFKHGSSLVPVAKPNGKWACLTFEADAKNIKYRIAVDGVVDKGFSIDITGEGCGGAAQNAPWNGPNFDAIGLGAMSSHSMSESLDMWVDDIVIDTQPVECPPQN